MNPNDVSGYAATAASILRRAADDLQVAALTLAQAVRVTVWESPAGDLARERLREHEELARQLEERSIAAAHGVEVVAANAEG